MSQTYLVSQTYKEGSFVKSGDVLSQVDPRPFQTTVTHEVRVHV